MHESEHLAVFLRLMKPFAYLVHLIDSLIRVYGVKKGVETACIAI